MVKYIYCNQCGAKNDSFNDFCTECGQKIGTTTAASHTIVQDNSSRVAVSVWNKTEERKFFNKKHNSLNNYCCIFWNYSLCFLLFMDF